MGRRKLVLTLIESDLTTSKLIFTLQNIGIDANDYLTDTSEVIFSIVGVKEKNRTEEFYRKYFDLIKQVEHIDVRVKSEKTRLALNIYGLLMANV